jgi:hypothetical protein
MRVEPNGAELLKIARETLLVELLPQLPESARYAARMAANAMAIAARALEAGAGAAAEELRRLEALLPGWKPQSADTGEAVREGNERLGAAIRAGRFDSGGARQALDEHLRATTLERLAVSNPRIISAAKP